MARVLGLDLGSHTLKAVVVETTYRGATVKSYFTAPVPPDGERMDRLKAALPRLLEQGAGHVDSVVISLPGTTHPAASRKAAALGSPGTSSSNAGSSPENCSAWSATTEPARESGTPSEASMRSV